MPDVTALEIDEGAIQSFISSLTLAKVLPAIVTWVVCWILIKFLLRGLERFLEKTHIEKSLHGFLRTLSRIGLYSLMVLLTASQLGIEVTSLVAVFSVAALALSLAIQGALSNLASGIVLLSAHPFKVGDFVELDSVSGTVTEIGLTYTRIATPDNKVVFAPNSAITSSKIINYTLEAKRRVDIAVTTSHSYAIDDVKAALYQSAETVGNHLSSPAPIVYVTAYQDGNIQYSLRVWVETADYWNVYFALLEQIKRDFDALGLQMTCPHLSVHMEQG